MQHSLNTTQHNTTQHSTSQVCSTASTGSPQRLQSHKFVCGGLLLLPAYTIEFFAILLHFAASLPVQRRSFMQSINLTQSQIRICVFYSHVTCCLFNFFAVYGQLHSDSGESDFLHFFCSARAIIAKSHL